MEDGLLLNENWRGDEEWDERNIFSKENQTVIAAYEQLPRHTDDKFAWLRA